MHNILEKLVELKNNRIDFGLCSVVETNDSSPAKVGMKMIVLEDGKTFGTVGGGALENEIIKNSLEFIKRGKSGLFEYKLENLGMTCGGDVKIFIEAVRNPSRLVIAGVGHIGRELMRIASGTSEFICKGFDSRKDNVEVLTENYDVEYLNCYDGIEKELRRGDYVVVMTHGHGFDSKVIKSISKIEGLKYVGCIGSKNKVKIMIDELKETGNCDEFVKILHSPVGLKIGANTPFEIAISILSEIVCVKNTGESVCSMRI